MALFRTGCFVLKTWTPVLANPGLMIPSCINIQVRNAARKGYREKKNKLRLAEKQKKLEAAREKDNQQQSKLKSRYLSIRKTVDLKKPEPPNDDVFITDSFNYKKYTIEEVIQYHKEYHHPTVYNNPNAPITVRLDIDMTGKKETQVMKPFSGIAAIPHPFVLKQAKEVLVFCEPNDVQMCMDCGASVAGGSDLIKKIQEGIVQLSLYNYVIAHTSFLPLLVPIRGLLKDQLPRAKKGNLTNDLRSAIAKFLHGVEYSCVKFECDHNFGIISVDVGRVDMPTDHIAANFKAVVEDILRHRPSTRPFITWAWCFSPPSDERFSLDLSPFMENEKAEEVPKSEENKKAEAKEIEKEKDEDENEEEKEVEAKEKV